MLTYKEIHIRTHMSEAIPCYIILISLDKCCHNLPVFSEEVLKKSL